MENKVKNTLDAEKQLLDNNLIIDKFDALAAY